MDGSLEVGQERRGAEVKEKQDMDGVTTHMENGICKERMRSRNE